MLLVNKNGFYVIGIDAGPKTIKCILSNLSGQIQNQVKVLIDSTGELTNEKFLALVKDAIHEILKEVDNREKILGIGMRSEEHTSELQSRFDIVCRILLEN